MLATRLEWKTMWDATLSGLPTEGPLTAAIYVFGNTATVTALKHVSECRRKSFAMLASYAQHGLAPGHGAGAALRHGARMEAT